MKLLVIIPAYNEEPNIDKVINNLTEFSNNFSNVSYVIINDGSTDKTKELLDLKKYNHIDLPCNMGLSSVMQLGYKYGYENGFDCAIQFDGDGQHQANYINDMLIKIEEGYDIVIGSRFVNKKKNKSLRMLGSRIITLLIKFVTKQYISDPTSGMRMLSRREMYEFAYNMNYKPEPDSLTKEILNGKRIVEIPVEMHERVSGTSIYGGLMNAAKYMVSMTISILLIRDRKD